MRYREMPRQKNRSTSAKAACKSKDSSYILTVFWGTCVNQTIGCLSAHSRPYFLSSSFSILSFHSRKHQPFGIAG